MVAVRNAPIAFRFDPDVKQALSIIAERDGRSMANMMEWLIRKHCEKEGLSWPPVGASEAGSGPHSLAKSTKAAKKSSAVGRTSKQTKAA